MKILIASDIHGRVERMKMLEELLTSSLIGFSF